MNLFNKHDLLELVYSLARIVSTVGLVELIRSWIDGLDQFIARPPPNLALRKHCGLIVGGQAPVRPP